MRREWQEENSDTSKSYRHCGKLFRRVERQAWALGVSWPSQDSETELVTPCNFSYRTKLGKKIEA